MTQELVIEAVKNMPKEFSINELLERLDFIEKVNVGLQQIEEGKTIPHEEVLKRVQEWRK